MLTRAFAVSDKTLMASVNSVKLSDDSLVVPSGVFNRMLTLPVVTIIRAGFVKERRFACHITWLSYVSREWPLAAIHNV